VCVVTGRLKAICDCMHLNPVRAGFGNVNESATGENQGLSHADNGCPVQPDAPGSNTILPPILG
jgi:hypothetical protein